MNNEIQILQERVRKLEEFIRNLQSGHSIPLYLDQALQGRGFIKRGSSEIFTVSEGGTGASTLTGILKGNGTSAFTAIAPLAGAKSYWVSDTLTGPITRNLKFTNGILTAET